MSSIWNYKGKPNTLDQLHDIIGWQIETTSKIIRFLKQTNLYMLI